MWKGNKYMNKHIYWHKQCKKEVLITVKYKDKEVQEMITSQPNSQDQQSIDILLDTSMVDA
jgi:hypothetical protein